MPNPKDFIRGPMIPLLMALCLATLGAWSGCGGDDNSPAAIDVTAPASVTQLQATIQANAVLLTWSNPADGDFAGVRVRRDTLAAPTDSTGTLVFDGMASDYTDAGITPGQSYFYAVFAFDTSGNLSDPATVQVSTLAPTTVTFPDANLEAAVRTALNISTGDILATDMLSLDELDLSGKAIADVTGLQFALNLGKLVLANNDLTDASHLNLLTALGKLWELDLTSNDISSIPDLTDLPLLRNLYLQGNPVQSLTPLIGMPALGQFDTSGETLTDLSPLSGISTLTSVGLFNTAITNLAPLANLTGLRSLNVYNAPVSDLSPLSGLSTMRNLEMAATAVADLSPLAGLTDLHSVNVSVNPQLHDLQALVDNAGLGEGDMVNAVACPLLHNAVAVQVPALVARGVQVQIGDGLPTDMVGLWSPVSATVNGQDQDLATFFDWDPATVDMRLSLFHNLKYLVQEIDAAGGHPYTESGTVTVDGDQVTLLQLTENGEDIPDGETFTASWTLDGGNLLISQVDGPDTAVITFARQSESD